MEVHYTKAQINNNISKLLEEGKSNDVAFDFFLMMNMVNDLGPERPFITKAPTPAEVRIHLLGNDAIDKDDVKLEMTNAKIPIQRLVVRLSSNCTLYAELSYNSLQVTVNGRNLTVMYLKYFRAEDIALWMIRQKQKLDEYIEAWDAVLAYACKKVKIDHMAFLGIRAIFTEAMKDYPRIKFAVIEQKRRAKIMVNIPNTDLGVYIYAWWGSYKKQLPEQIESLKVLLDAHRKSSLKNFFIHH
jgi:hypothetical protein